ncbi:hypothetical protein ACVILL_001013 [Bradyrhizobium sp. USDA 3364]
MAVDFSELLAVTVDDRHAVIAGIVAISPSILPALVRITSFPFSGLDSHEFIRQSDDSQRQQAQFGLPGLVDNK